MGLLLALLSFKTHGGLPSSGSLFYIGRSDCAMMAKFRCGVGTCLGFLASREDNKCKKGPLYLDYGDEVLGQEF